ncbi:MAG: cyclic nucleotide-binding domain-containing protein, partial [Deltaproteobacteria bacterium]|nr:cyclic nucleotide-binding domain-containing protein [Deltaproteobacteria bacterium]
MKVQSKKDALVEEYEKFIAKGKFEKALEVLRELQRLEPGSSRWHQKAGESLRRMGRSKEAAAEFEEAARLWAKEGFIARAIAMAKLVVELDPTRKGILAEIDPSVAQEEHRKVRPLAQSWPEKLEEAAPVLLPDPEASEEEIRFVSEPSGTIDLSEVTLVEDEEDQEPLTTLYPSEAPQIDRLAALPGFPIFAELPKEVLQELAELSELVELPHRAFVFRRGDDADSLYAIVEGAVRVNVPGEPILREGETFGESCLTRTHRRNADAIVQGKLLALRLHRDHLQKIAQKAPRLERLLIENLARRVLAAVFDCHRLFVGLSPDERRELGHLFEMRRAIPRFPLFVRGKVSDSMYVVVTDYLEVELSSGLVVVAESGSVLGERSLLQPGPSDITARAPEGA